MTRVNGYSQALLIKADKWRDGGEKKLIGVKVLFLICFSGNAFRLN